MSARFLALTNREPEMLWSSIRRSLGELAQCTHAKRLTLIGFVSAGVNVATSSLGRTGGQWRHNRNIRDGDDCCTLKSARGVNRPCHPTCATVTAKRLSSTLRNAAALSRSWAKASTAINVSRLPSKRARLASDVMPDTSWCKGAREAKPFHGTIACQPNATNWCPQRHHYQIGACFRLDFLRNTTYLKQQHCMPQICTSRYCSSVSQ